MKTFLAASLSWLRRPAGWSAALTLAVALTACATTKTPSTAKLLSDAGFKTVVADTPARQERLKSLPTDKISRVTKDGQIYYVYPQAKQNALLVGRPDQYQAYRQLLIDQKVLQRDRQAYRDAQAQAQVEATAETTTEMSGWEAWGSTW